MQSAVSERSQLLLLVFPRSLHLLLFKRGVRFCCLLVLVCGCRGIFTVVALFVHCLTCVVSCYSCLPSVVSRSSCLLNVVTCFCCLPSEISRQCCLLSGQLVLCTRWSVTVVYSLKQLLLLFTQCCQILLLFTCYSQLILFFTRNSQLLLPFTHWFTYSCSLLSSVVNYCCVYLVQTAPFAVYSSVFRCCLDLFDINNLVRASSVLSSVEMKHLHSLHLTKEQLPDRQISRTKEAKL